ncbi:hypothetical protein GOV14_06235 [Candidatus Pacearchaeota archaeon]|nr:hypothetical protein [Candidatus Pacearchaeota archaeon]
MTQKRYIIFDAGPLINFSMNGLLPLLERLKENFPGEFLITKEVKEEIIDHPSKIKRFELGALRLRDLFNRGIIKHAELTPEQVSQLKKKRDEILNISNTMFRAKKRNIHILDKGEAAAFALEFVLKDESVLAIDERTARMLVENPESARQILENKLHTKVTGNKKNYNYFDGFKVIRSSELIYIANKLNLIQLKDPKAYRAMLYGIKYKGCSVSMEEIKQLIKL